jgi:hypothetical protein
MLGWSKKLEYIFKITNTKNKPIKPKISSAKNSKREKKTMIFIEKKSPNAILEISAILKYIP